MTQPLKEVALALSRHFVPLWSVKWLALALAPASTALAIVSPLMERFYLSPLVVYGGIWLL